MISKKKKYSNILNLKKQLIQFNDKSLIFVHINNMTIIEDNLIQTCCLKHNIKQITIKLNLFKKLYKNHNLINLLSGPSKIFFFENLLNIIDFFEIDVIKKKLIPLAIYFNNIFYNYKFFKSFIKNYYSSYNIINIYDKLKNVNISIFNKLQSNFIILILLINKSFYNINK